MSKTIIETIKRLVVDTLPGFSQSIAAAPQRKSRKLDITSQRSDTIRERLLFDLHKEPDGCSIGIQLAVSYFPECPIPAGPFGMDASLRDLTWELPGDPFSQFWEFGRWYRVPDATDIGSEWCSCFVHTMEGTVRATFDQWAQQLLMDDVLRIATGIYNQYQELPLKEVNEATLFERVVKLGPSIREYSAEKLADQLIQRLRGNKRWHLV